MSVFSRHIVSVAALQRFAAGAAKPRERRWIVRHLLTGCGPCGEWLRVHAWGLTGEREPPPTGAYDTAFAVAERTALVEAERCTTEVRKLLADIDATLAEERELRVRNQRPFASTRFAAALIERSHQARWRDPAAMLADAQLAVAAAEAALAIGRGEELESLNDCLARTWGQLANAHRLRGSLLDAEDAFAVAFHHLEDGTGELGLRALLYRQLASLRRARRQHLEAIELFRRAIATYRRLDDRAGEASALINLGISYIYAGEPRAAVAPLTRCIEELDPRLHVDLVRAASTNLVRCYLDLGEPARAHALWAETEPLFSGCDDELLLLRRSWHRGLIDRELGHLGVAESRLWEVREGFLRHELTMESAIASLHLAAIYLRQHRVADVVRTIGEIIPIFQSLGWEQEILASLTQLAGVAHDVRAALELLQHISRSVEHGADNLASATLPHD
jgi:tetratricopeptide (TPR) repeat protein